MKENQFHNKIYWFTFAFSILVVWMHAYNSELFLGRARGTALIYTTEHGTGDTIAQITVPGFFMISAYLFYHNSTWERLWPKWNFRVHNILIPSIVRNTLCYLGYAVGSRLPFVTDVMGKRAVPLGLMPVVGAVARYTYNYVFWHLYQPASLTTLVPVIHPVIHGRYLGAVLIVLMVIDVYFGPVLPQLNLDALLYYCTGTYAVIHLEPHVETWSRSTALKSLLLFLGVAMYHFAPGIIGDNTTTIALFRLFVPVILWMMVDEHRSPPARTQVEHSFSFYTTHFALVRLINRTIVLFLPTALYLPLTIYLPTSVLALLISYPVEALLRRYLPWVRRLINRGR